MVERGVTIGRRMGRSAARLAAIVLALMAVSGLAAPAFADAMAPLKIVVLGDSLSAGYGLAANEAFPAKLQAALRAKGESVEIANAGVSGDTASGGRDRLDWSVPDGTDAVIVELGANDALRGIDPKLTRTALDEIIARLRERGVKVLLAGMLAARNYGADYAARFDPIFPELAAAHRVPLYPFFLDGVVGDAKLNQRDGIHPTAAGIDIIVERILPTVEAFLADVRMARSGAAVR